MGIVKLHKLLKTTNIQTIQGNDGWSLQGPRVNPILQVWHKLNQKWIWQAEFHMQYKYFDVIIDKAS